MKEKFVSTPLTEEEKTEMVAGYFNNAHWLWVNEDYLNNAGGMVSFLMSTFFEKYEFDENDTWQIWGYGTIQRSVNGYPMVESIRIVSWEDHKELGERINATLRAMHGIQK